MLRTLRSRSLSLSRCGGRQLAQSLLLLGPVRSRVRPLGCVSWAVVARVAWRCPCMDACMRRRGSQGISLHGLVVAGDARGHGRAHLCVLLADGWAAGRGRGLAWEMGISSAASIGSLSIADADLDRLPGQTGANHQARGMQQDAKPDSGAAQRQSGGAGRSSMRGQSGGAGRSSMRGQSVLLVSCGDRGAACMHGVGRLGQAVWHDGGHEVAARARGCVGKLGRAVWRDGGHGVVARARG